jgi:hypothetical protein
MLAGSPTPRWAKAVMEESSKRRKERTRWIMVV